MGIGKVFLDLLAPFFPELLIFISGFCVFYGMRGKRIGQFLSGRIRKIAIPFLFGFLVCYPLVQWLGYLIKGKETSFLNFLKDYIHAIVMGVDFTGFYQMDILALLYLFLFCILCLPVFLLGKCRYWDYERVFARSEEVTFVVYRDYKRYEIFSKTAFFMSRSYLLLLTALLFPMLSLIPYVGKTHILSFLVLFLFGYVFATDERYQEALERDKWRYLAVCAGCYLFLFLRSYEILFQGRGIFLQILENYLGEVMHILPVFTVMGFIRSVSIEEENVLLSYLKKRSYPLFIIHLPILAFLVFLEEKIKLPAAAGFLLVTAGTFILGFAVLQIYDWLKKKPAGGVLGF